MEVKIIDTTLRDGEQQKGIALNVAEKIEIASLLDEMKVNQIEVGIPAMGGIEKESISEISQLGLRAKISTWNRMKISDIEHSLDCGADIIHVSVPVSDLLINVKLKYSRENMLKDLEKCLNLLEKEKCMYSVGLEDASRADMFFVNEVMDLIKEYNAYMVRYADTVGIHHRNQVTERIGLLNKKYKIPLGIHAHNDFGMALSNSVAAVISGAKYVDCTIGGIGERAGNCDYLKFIQVVGNKFSIFKRYDMNVLKELQDKVLGIMGQ